MSGTVSKPLSAPPRWATPRTPDRWTEGNAVASVAAALGTPFMPWQRLVVDVAGERLPDGRYAYPVVVVTVPRQSGKTTLLRARGVARCLMRPDTQVFYTAQTGKDARERWEDLVKQIAAGPLRARVVATRAAGAVRLKFPNTSAFRVFAPVPSSLHGYTPDEVMIDEAWAFDAARGDALMGAIVPAQITVTDRQLWIVSTAGTSDSAFLRQWVDDGRNGAAGVAYFEWSAPDDADLFDPAAIRAYHPAIGHTIEVDDIIAAATQLSRGEYERAYGNRWTRTIESWVPADEWAGLAGPQTPPPPGAVHLAADVAYDRRSADIVAAWVDSDGVTNVRVVRTDAGDRWLPVELDRIAGELSPRRPVGVDDAGPVRTAAGAVTHPIRYLTTAEFGAACGELLTDIRTGRFRHDGSERLARAVEDAITRPLGDLWVFSRRSSKGPISALTATAVAAYLARHPRRPAAPPFIVTGDTE